ncbi:putative membrane protein [Vibrio mimicus]|nr:putative membrane protein [Vibrio mimicus]
MMDKLEFALCFLKYLCFAAVVLGGLLYWWADS